MAKTRADEIKEKFIAYHKANPEVWNLFRKFAQEVFWTGRARYSSKAIIERIRWHIEITTASEEFKISNDFTPYYARMFNLSCGTGFFKTKKLRSQEGKAKFEGEQQSELRLDAPPENEDALMEELKELIGGA